MFYLDSGGDASHEETSDAAGSEDEYYIHTIYIHTHTYTQ